MKMWAQSTSPGAEGRSMMEPHQQEMQSIMAASGPVAEKSTEGLGATGASTGSAEPFEAFQAEGSLSQGLSGTHGQVMTDEQMEVLRRQISVYATICQQLVEMHKAVVSQQNLPGLRLGHVNPYDPVMTMSGHKMTARQRWSPTQMQLQILENIFEQGNGTPSKQKIKEITAELAQHGQISETNVYNWFQNRRARTKRKQQLISSNNTESEVETDNESPVEKKGKTEHTTTSQEGQGGRETGNSFHCADAVSEQHQFQSQHGSAVAFCPHTDHKSVMNFSRIPSFEAGITSSRIGQFMGLDESTDNFPSINGAEAYPVMSIDHLQMNAAFEYLQRQDHDRC